MHRAAYMKRQWCKYTSLSGLSNMAFQTGTHRIEYPDKLCAGLKFVHYTFSIVKQNLVERW